MTIQAILFILIISAFYGCLFHVITGGNFFTMIVDIFIAIAGFFTGQFIGNIVGREVLRVGVINLGWGTAISIVFLIVGGMISRPLF